jgi:hypothetical protein
MAVKVWVGRFAIVDGQPQEEGPLLRSFPRQRPDDDEDELYVLVEPTGEGNKEYYAQLVDAVGRMYQQDTLSITGAVLRAMQASHRQLLDWNARTLREQHVSAGATCLAVRSRTAYLAQIGPAVAFHVGDGHFTRVTPEAGATEALGVAQVAEPTFNRFELGPGDLLLVASTGIERVVDDDLLRSILLRGGDDALVELFRIARDLPEFSLVLLACVVEPDDEDAAGTAPTPFATEQTAMEPDAEVDLAPPLHGEREEPVAPEPDMRSAQTIEPPRFRTPAAAAATAGAASLSFDEAASLTPPAGLSQPKVRMKGQESAIDYRRTTGPAAWLPNISPVAVAITLILIIVGLLAWQIIPRALEDNKEERFQSNLADAQSALNAALATNDTAAKRELLREAEVALSEAEGYRAGDARVIALSEQVDAALAELNAILVLPDLEQIVDISGRVTGAVSSRDLALGGGGAYFLDRDQGRVIGVSLLTPNPDPFVMYEEGSLIGTELAAKAHSMAWAEGTGALLVMDEQRSLVAVRPPNTGERLTVRAANEWGSEDGIGSFDNALYVLDRGSDQVWRYPDGESGFDSEREGVLPSFELDSATEMAAADPLYLLFNDGSIARFSGSVAQPFSQAGLDKPMSSPGSITPLPGQGMVLVADRGNSRIVVFSPDGTFRQQLVSPRFTDLRAIAVDEQAGLLYILNGTSLYRTPLPPLP